MGEFVRFQRFFKIGLSATLLTFALALLGEGLGRVFALIANAVLFLLWIQIHAGR